jgi:manganese/iron transport system ATP-binding protein
MKKNTHIEHAHSYGSQGKAIEMKNVSLTYGEHLALDEISLTVASGERIAVVGPNGAGKSSLFHVLSGVMSASSGLVSVHGHMPARYLCTAYVSQSHQLDWDFPLCVADVVMMGRAGILGLFKRPGKLDQDLVKDALERMGISDLADRPIAALSSGQRQRMFIARALAQEAELLLLDEPLTGLDPTSQEHFFELLDKLKEEAVTVLMATHDLNLAAERFDRVLLLHNEMLGIGSAESVFSEENLQKAYGGHVHLVETKEGSKILGDMGGHHEHSEERTHA